MESSKPRKLLNVTGSAVSCKTCEINSRTQATFIFLLVAMQNKGWRYWMMQYNQS